ncbi:TetR/AcrR family transcriptional regulator [Streptomyces sp. NPDC046465]|uniref:TetR/AcrR family transcriptional regulator n=1 Tax=Streptomyces sp. NPDC046465 TaxID=3155810 RepID=UPI0033C868C6
MAADSRRLQPRKRPLQARAELTRQRILAAAAHVFADHGYAAGTTNRIAERARISIGSLYQYYPNKDAILIELLMRHLDAGMVAIRRRTAAGLPDSLEEIIRGVVRTTIDNHRDDPQLLRVFAEQGPRSPALLEKVTANERERIEYVEELLENHPEVRVEDTRVAARLFVSTAELLIHQLVAAPDPVDLERLENELVAMLTRYLTAAPPSD